MIETSRSHLWAVWSVVALRRLNARDSHYYIVSHQALNIPGIEAAHVRASLGPSLSFSSNSYTALLRYSVSVIRAVR